MLLEASVRINRHDFDAVIFDLDGVRSSLAARGIQLPEGSEHDGEDAETVHTPVIAGRSCFDKS